jgi:alpha-D-ribose 1-methylphosphonate 5-triphosphate synthase subunit PhnG
LFILLKLNRLSAVDLEDCVALVAHCERSGEAIDHIRACARLDALPQTNDASLAARRARLREVLASTPA